MARASVVVIAERVAGIHSPDVITSVSERFGLRLGRIIERASFDLAGDADQCDAAAKALRSEWRDHPADINVVRHVGARIRTLLSDMDSTVITSECMDEMAAFCGIGDEIKAITKRAMNGELDFEESLLARLSHLAGLSTSGLEKIWNEQVHLTEGARELIQTLSARTVETILISGGFTWFAERVGASCGFDRVMANELEITDGVLTGRVTGNILSADSKLAQLKVSAHTLSDGESQILAIGDGANDLPMLTSAGLGIAYKAHDIVRNAVPVQINHHGLESVIQLVDAYETGAQDA